MVISLYILDWIRPDKFKGLPKEEDKILNTTSTYIADDLEIEPKWRHLTQANLADNAVQVKLGYASQFNFSAGTSELRRFMRMLYQLKEEDEDLKTFIEQGYITPSILDRYHKSCLCSKCGRTVTVSHGSGHSGFNFSLLRMHIFGKKHQFGRVAGEPLLGCYAGLTDIRDQDEYLAIFKLWRAANPEALNIQNSGTFDCAVHGRPDLGTVDLTNLRSFLGRLCGTRSYNSEKRVCTGQMAEDLKPLVLGMKCCPEEWKVGQSVLPHYSTLSNVEIRSKREEYIREWNELSQKQLKKACEDLKEQGETIACSKESKPNLRTRLKRWLDKKYPEPNDTSD